MKQNLILNNLTDSQFKELVNKPTSHPIFKTIADQLTEYLNDADLHLYRHEMNNTDLINNLIDEVHDDGYHPDEDKPRNECTYPITKNELALYIEELESYLKTL